MNLKNQITLDIVFYCHIINIVIPTMVGYYPLQPAFAMNSTLSAVLQGTIQHPGCQSSSVAMASHPRRGPSEPSVPTGRGVARQHSPPAMAQGSSRHDESWGQTMPMNYVLNQYIRIYQVVCNYTAIPKASG